MEKDFSQMFNKSRQKGQPHIPLAIHPKAQKYQQLSLFSSILPSFSPYSDFVNSKMVKWLNRE